MVRYLTGKPTGSQWDDRFDSHLSCQRTSQLGPEPLAHLSHVFGIARAIFLWQRAPFYSSMASMRCISNCRSWFPAFFLSIVSRRHSVGLSEAPRCKHSHFFQQTSSCLCQSLRAVHELGDMNFPGGHVAAHSSVQPLGFEVAFVTQCVYETHAKAVEAGARELTPPGKSHGARSSPTFAVLMVCWSNCAHPYRPNITCTQPSMQRIVAGEPSVRPAQ